MRPLTQMTSVGPLDSTLIPPCLIRQEQDCRFICSTEIIYLGLFSLELAGRLPPVIQADVGLSAPPLFTGLNRGALSQDSLDRNRAALHF